MTKNNKLKKLLRYLTSPDEVTQSFELFDEELSDATQELKNTIQDNLATTIENELKNIEESIVPLRQSLEEIKIPDLSPLTERAQRLEENSRSQAQMLGSLESKVLSIPDQLSQLQQSIDNTSQQIPHVTATLSGLERNFLGIKSAQETLTNNSKITLQNYEKLRSDLETFTEVQDRLRKDLLSFANRGGGNMNRRITVSGSDPLTKYTDINFKAGTGVTLTPSTDETNKRVDLTVTATGAVSSVSNSNGTLTISPTTGAVIASLNLAKANTWTGVQTFSPTARTTGSASYFVVNAPADTGITSATESIGINHVGATRTWVDGTVVTQREYVFQAPTYNKTTTSATFTTVSTFYVSGAPVAGSGVTITNGYSAFIDGTNSRIGAVAAGTPNSAVEGIGLEVTGTNNTTGGMNLTIANTSNGTSAFVDLFLQNDLANSAGAHFGVLNYSSSTYTDSTFGTILAAANQLALYQTDGSTLIGSASAAGFVQLFTGGTASTNGRFAINANGNISTGNSKSVVYRNPNNVANSNANLMIEPAGSVSSASANFMAFDTTNWLMFGSPNGTRRIAMASIQLVNKVTTANSEAADLAFFTKPGSPSNTAMTQYMTLTSTGLLFVGGTTTPTAFIHAAASTTSAASMRIAAGTAPTSPNEGDMWVDSTQKAVLMYADGIKQSAPGTLFTQTADKSVSNTTTETTIVGTGVGGLTLPANFWVAGKTIRVTMSGVYSTVAVTGDTVTIKVKYGTTVLASKATTALVTGGTNLFWASEVIVTCRSTGATGTVQVSGGVIYQIAGSATVEDELNNGVATTTLDTTASGLFDITITHSAANGSNTVKSLVGTFEVMN